MSSRCIRSAASLEVILSGHSFTIFKNEGEIMHPSIAKQIMVDCDQEKLLIEDG